MPLTNLSVRTKLAVLVLLPMAVIGGTLPLLSSALHRELMEAAHDHVTDAEKAFQVEMEDDLADMLLAARMMAAAQQTHHAVETHDAADALAAAREFEKLYPRTDIILAKEDGEVLGDIGPSVAPARLDEIPELRGLPRDREAHFILPGGCAGAAVRAKAARAVTAPVGDHGWVVVCESLDRAYLENAGHKLNMELALLDGRDATVLTDTMEHFPLQALKMARDDARVLEIGDQSWVVERFVPRQIDSIRGGKMALVAAVDVSEMSRSMHRHLHLMLLVLAGVALLGALLAMRMAGAMSRGLQAVIAAFRKLAQQEYVQVPVLRTHDELELLAHGFNHMVEGLKERDKLRTTFGKYMTESVLEHLLQGKVALGGETLRVTVLFSDIRSFTSLSERMDAHAVVALLNEYFTEMVSIVMKWNGVVDKYIGDAIMAVFGAPVPGPDDACNAVCAAVEMRAALVKLNERLTARGAPEIRTGIGIHTGEVVAGNIGSEQRMEYTVIGDTVNLASRLESSTKELAVGVLISHTTYEAAARVVEARPVKEIVVKGRAQPVMTYEVLGARPPAGA